MKQGHVNRILTNLRTRKANSKPGWAVLTHLPYSLDLASLDFRPFGPMRNAIWGRWLWGCQEGEDVAPNRPHRTFIKEYTLISRWQSHRKRLRLWRKIVLLIKYVTIPIPYFCSVWSFFWPSGAKVLGDPIQWIRCPYMNGLYLLSAPITEILSY